MPVTPQVLTTGCPPDDMGQLGIFSPVLVAVVTGKTLWFFSRHFLIKFSVNAGRYHFQCAQGISVCDGDALVALPSQGIKLSVTGDSVLLEYLSYQRFFADDKIRNLRQHR